MPIVLVLMVLSTDIWDLRSKCTKKRKHNIHKRTLNSAQECTLSRYCFKSYLVNIEIQFSAILCIIGAQNSSALLPFCIWATLVVMRTFLWVTFFCFLFIPLRIITHEFDRNIRLIATQAIEMWNEIIWSVHSLHRKLYNAMYKYV